MGFIDLSDWKAVEEAFRVFGIVNVERRYTWHSPAPDEVEIQIYIQPDLFPGVDMSTYAGVRRACFELSEQAIALAQDSFTLVGPPRYKVTGGFTWLHWYKGEYIIRTQAELELAVTEKRGDECGNRSIRNGS